MGKLNLANLKKTIYYLRRNGLKNTWYAAKERMEEQNALPYSFMPITEEEAEMQRKASEDMSVTFSIAVPTYHTKEEQLQEMIESVLNQTYPRWELVLADASSDDSVEKVVKTFADDRIRYIRLQDNAGISENTNRAIEAACGEYIGLLDHDDVLTQDALYEMASAIENGKKAGIEVKLLYSDEDKCNGDRTQYFEPHQKEDFNLDLFLSNNYICHFMVLESELIKELKFRKEYDGAQDYDLALRAVSELLEHVEQIAHIGKVLYHWRCHADSTAQNPQSKQYAYEAGKRAVQAFADRHGYKAQAEHLKHLGFYRLEYKENPLKTRADLGAVGGKLIKKGKIAGGRISRQGDVYYGDLPAVFSGPFHRAVLQQNAEAVDIRCIQMKEECYSLFEEIVGVPYRETVIRENSGKNAEEQRIFDVSLLPTDSDFEGISIALGKALKEAGYRILWEPNLQKYV